MVVLRAIGRFFARIGRWIKETAWVQPLLIVGGIFGIIFSIPHLTKWVGSWFDGSKTAAVKYFEDHELSLDGSQNGSKTSWGDSEADKLFKAIESKSLDGTNYPKKFFVTFLKDSNTDINDRYLGFKTLQEKWNKNNEFNNLDGEFALYTIDIEETNKSNDELWNDFYERIRNKGLFDNICQYLKSDSVKQSDDEKHHYAIYKGTGYDTSLEDLNNLNKGEEMSLPVTLLFDFTADGQSYAKWINSEWHVREVLFSFNKTTYDSNDFGYAKTLYYSWVNKASKDNPFSIDYKNN